MDKQEFGQSEELLHLRETPLRQPIEVRFVLRQEDVVEGVLAVMRLKRWNAVRNLLIVMGGLLVLLGNWYFGLFAVLFAVFLTQGMVRTARQNFRKEPLLQEPVHWIFGPDEVTVDHPRATGQQDWSVYKRVVETRNLFMLFPQENLYNPIPKRAFADAAEMERFRELVREKGIEIKVVGVKR